MTEKIVQFRNPALAADLFERAARGFREGLVEPVEPEMAAAADAAAPEPVEHDASTKGGGDVE